MPSLIHTLQKLVKKVDHAPDIQHALEIIVENLIDALKIDTCSIFIKAVNEKEQLVLMANRGLNEGVVGQIKLNIGEGLVGMVAEKAEPIRLDHARSHKNFVYFEESGEEAFPIFMGIPIISQRKILGVLVLQRAQIAFDSDDEAFMTTLATQLANAITHARSSGEIASLLTDRSASISCTLSGVAGAPGLTMGQAVVINHGVSLHNVADKRISDKDDITHEVKIFEAAVDQVKQSLYDQAERMKQSLPLEECALFTAYAQMLDSGSLIEDTRKRIQEGHWAPSAWRETIQEHADVFSSMEDEYLAERANDILDLGRRVLQRMLSTQVGERIYPQKFVLVGEEISATDLASVPLEGLQAIVSEHGSGASHVAILAHALSIPAVMGVTNLPYTQMEGLVVVADGYSGKAYIDPKQNLLDELKIHIAEEEQITDSLNELKSKPAITTDGYRVSLYVNSGLMSDHSPSLRSGAEGVGLYRTEIPFQIRESFPSEDEQFRIYRNVLKTFDGMPVVLRTLDVGGDKPLSYFPIKEDNPFLGWRGIRITLDHPDIFITQVRAMMRANVGLNNLHILLPMISGIQELDDALILIHRAKDEIEEELGEPLRFPHIGAMIEVPSSIYQIDEICQLVDFVSIGTNDLTQYLLAVDRNNESVADLFSSLHPSVLRALEQIVQGANRQNTPVSVCGELAGDPMGVMALMGLGIESLSMSTGSLPRAKKVIRSFSLSELSEFISITKNMSDAQDVRNFYIEQLDDRGLGGLIRAGK
ncbi:MAG: phosphoenolpyruvate--protein phosphotransferase [Gammaproteobacteria bacterium]|jgi:phosphotransferase system enzyme I (PtsP)|nr:phosphoenolpyruvate--protein phosphotransferase [Gammaproteobacteria bacterium]MBT3725772.1 phosphoenolpyruvate--protein phosphotransferase [Gammaproteobacteria bacterium]MBT4196058.1 phosphoenolpyruvate--protein phosphotransferase [Gammaproteobacteria bacterium]MBT4861370.1 phosphoenolpyruvate--protein phosphotransferase [Gammaproteobacteria bacterium]MBT6454985.1 phosphoenolpyruvate--protein phosphotransferase [Gammaproteobacteria bacterium]